MVLTAFVLVTYFGSDLAQIKSEASTFLKERDIAVRWEYPATKNTESWHVTSKPVGPSMEADAMAFWKIFKQEFAKYPKCFLKLSGLKEVDFVWGLAVGGQVRSAMPDFINERLVLDVSNIKSADWFVRHVIHHEYYHMIEEQTHGSAYYKDPEWSKLNPSSFKYGDGGAKMRDGSVTPLKHPEPGFVNLYSTAGLEEDKAEIWAVMFCSSDWKTIAPWLKEDHILASKIQYLEDFASSACPEMDASYWSKVRQG